MTMQIEYVEYLLNETFIMKAADTKFTYKNGSDCKLSWHLTCNSLNSNEQSRASRYTNFVSIVQCTENEMSRIIENVQN